MFYIFTKNFAFDFKGHLSNISIPTTGF